MSGKKVKINIIDINDVQETSKKFKLDISNFKDGSVYEQVTNDNIKGDKTNDYDSESIYFKENSTIKSKHFTLFLEKIYDFYDENKNEIKIDLNELRSKGQEKRDSLNKFSDIDLDKFDKIRELPKDIVDEIFLSTNSFYNWLKYEKNKENGREIKIDKK